MGAAISVGVAACGAPAVETPNTLRIGVTNDFLIQSFDPTLLPAYQIAAQAVYDTLFQNDSAIEYGGFEPNVATGYERSDDWTRVTLTLRDDVSFVDGEALTATALKTYLEGMAALDDWWFKSTWDQASPSLTAEDATTLTITSDDPMALNNRGFLHNLFTQVVLASPASLEDLASTTTDPLGSGPYTLDSLTPEVEATFVRNDEYWNPEAFPFDTIELSVFIDNVAALNALQAGQIDATSLSSSLAGQAEDQGFALTTPSIGGRSVMLYIADREGTVNPAFADPRVRQAMALAFDREAINDSLNLGFGKVSSQPFVETQPEYVPGGDDRYAYDPERARELMAEAGYADGFDLEIPSTSFFSINTWEPVVAQFLGDIGIRVTFKTMEVGDFFGAAISGTDHPVVMYIEGFWQLIPVFITADATFNPFKIQDPVVDSLWETVQSGPEDAATAAAADLGEYVLDQSILITIATPDVVWATAPGFAVPNLIGFPALSNFEFTG
jgi:peptide/nickel transport system substrate-binding protein